MTVWVLIFNGFLPYLEIDSPQILNPWTSYLLPSSSGAESQANIWVDVWNFIRQKRKEKKEIIWWYVFGPPSTAWGSSYGPFPDPLLSPASPVTMPDPLAHRTFSLVSSRAFPAPLHGIAQFTGSCLPTLLLREWQVLGALMGEKNPRTHWSPVLLVSCGPAGSPRNPPSNGWSCAHRVPGRAQHLTGS